MFTINVLQLVFVGTLYMNHIVYIKHIVYIEHIVYIKHIVYNILHRTV